MLKITPPCWLIWIFFLYLKHRSCLLSIKLPLVLTMGDSVCSTFDPLNLVNLFVGFKYCRELFFFFNKNLFPPLCGLLYRLFIIFFNFVFRIPTLVVFKSKGISYLFIESRLILLNSFVDSFVCADIAPRCNRCTRNRLNHLVTLTPNLFITLPFGRLGKLLMLVGSGFLNCFLTIPIRYFFNRNINLILACIFFFVLLLTLCRLCILLLLFDKSPFVMS